MEKFLSDQTQATNHQLATNHLSITANHFSRPSQDEIQANLFWAGRNLLALSVGSISPKLKSSSAFSGYFPDEIFKFSSRPAKIYPPSPQDIDKIDPILASICLVSDLTSRRIIQARCLINPVSHQHLFTWARISRLLTISLDSTKKKYFRGLDEIKFKLDPVSWQKIKKYQHQ
jgi:hypothetical protein